jgi:hypothetical protein
MKDEILKLIRQGLYQDNLQKLIPLCKGLFDECPCVYGSLMLIFESLAEEYDNQAITVSRYNLVMGELQQPILRLLESEDDSVLLDGLNELFKAFVGLGQRGRMT